MDVCLETEIENYLRCFDRFLLKLRGSFSIHADEFALRALVLEFYKALDQCEERVVLAAANIIARLPLRSTLPSEYISAEHMLATELLQAKPLCIRVATVSG